MKKIYSLIGIFGLLACVSCSDLLDEMPDNRTEIDTPKKLQLLMTSAYPTTSAALLCELSGDNLVDNNVHVKATRNSAYATFHEEAYAWEDIKNYSQGQQDTPYKVWEENYYGIAVCNHALEAIEQMIEEDPSVASKILPYKGEALVTRAFLHFTLLNVFAMSYRDEELSKQDLGIPYITEPETKVLVDYARPSVDSVYNCIERDIIEGLPLIDDSYYTIPAYHMNKAAANAFAARFYLFKRDYDKCIEHANAALGTNPATMLRKWSTINPNTIDTRLNWYNDETAPCNFLIQSCYSIFARALSACRFAINGKPADVSTFGSGPSWKSNGMLPCYSGNLFIWGKQDYGVWLFRNYEYFEYTDKIAGIGYVHQLYQPLTAEETLLCRAEAKLFSGDEPGCISDLDMWSKSKMVTTTLTKQLIDDFYTANAYAHYSSELNNELMSPSFVIPEGSLNTVHCILHFRRIETMYEGFRWFDIKRYGIPVVHEWKGPSDDVVSRDSLGWNDPRRALQIPNDVIEAGMEPNRVVPHQQVSGNIQTNAYAMSAQ